MSMSEFSRLERMSLLSSYFIISSLEFTWCIGKLMKLLPFCFWMWTSANMSVKLRMNGSLLSLEDITIPSVNTLRIYLETNDHVFEGRVLQLLAKCAGIRELNLSFQSRDEVIISFVIYYYSTFSASSGYSVLNNGS